MNRFSFLLLAIPLMQGCTQLAEEPEAAVEDGSVSDVEYNCSRGDPIRVQFNFAKETAILFRNEDALELLQKPVGSGFLYSNGPTTIRGKGDELKVEIGRMAAIMCTAK